MTFKFKSVYIIRTNILFLLILIIYLIKKIWTLKIRGILYLMLDI